MTAVMVTILKFPSFVHMDLETKSGFQEA